MAHGRTELFEVIRQVRNRWRLRLAARGALIVLAGTVLALLVSAHGLETFRFSAPAIILFRAVAIAVFAALVFYGLVLPLRRRVTDSQVALYRNGAQVGGFSFKSNVYRPYDARTQSWDRPCAPPCEPPATPQRYAQRRDCRCDIDCRCDGKPCDCGGIGLRFHDGLIRHRRFESECASKGVHD